MKFSIISTFYNNSIEEIERLKDSILSQTYTKWEWIISDDFSKESTDHIDYLKQLPLIDKRIKYIEQKFKKEIFWNPQTYATGDLITLVGGDDVISPKTLEIFYYHFLTNPELILITSESNIFKPHLDYSSFLNYVDDCNLFDKRHKFPLGWLNMGVPLTWKNIPIDFTEGFNLSGREIINDYLIHTRLEELGKFLHLPRVFYDYHIRQESVSRKIDSENSHKEHDINEINRIIENRRGGKVINSASDFYNSIVEESIVFYYSKLNKEKTCQEVSVITNTELNTHKKNKLKNLWVDHNIHFNKFSQEIDYYLMYFNSNSQIEESIELYNSAKNYKEIVTVICDNEELYKTIAALGPHFWFVFNKKVDGVDKPHRVIIRS